MKKALLGFGLAFVAGSTLAGETFRFDRGVVSVGDSVSALIQKAGRQPDRIVTLENHRGGAVGERWEYFLRDKQVNFTTKEGRVDRIDEIR